MLFRVVRLPSEHLLYLFDITLVISIDKIIEIPNRPTRVNETDVYW